MYILIGAGVLVVIAGVYIFTTLSRFAESSGALEQISRELLTRLQKIEMRLEETEARVNDNFAAMRKEQRESASEARSEQTRGISAFGEIQASRLKEIGVLQRDNFKNFSEQLTGVSRLNEEKLEAIRSVVEEKLLELIKGNEEKLEKMRATVDEKLHETLEKRLGEAFSSVSERLEEVHKGLGEMRALTTDVGDLKKVLSNVKVRGTWGEMQLGAMLEQILSKEQYAENIATRPNSRERVEFAVILPGTGGGRVFLPIDSKFPLEDYRALVSAS
ncbi:MAG: DNA recombination protein RmuC, partial [Synergistes sp.]|nr:DNA recombination protein RmuC [Synergistes sp.]